MVRTELAFQQAQQAKREASTALSAGDTRTAVHALRRAKADLLDAMPAAPAAMVTELRDELGMLSQLEDQAVAGDVVRAAKLSSADVAFKSRTRGRHRPSA